MNPATQQFLQLYIPLLATVTTLVVVLVGFIYNNSRLSDLRGDLLSRIDDTRDLLRAGMEIHRAETKSEMQELRHLMEKQHGDILRMLADHDQRMNRLEERK